MAGGRNVCGGQVVGLLLLFLAAWSDGVHVIDVTTVRSRAEPYASRDPLNLGRVEGLHRQLSLFASHPCAFLEIKRGKQGRDWPWGSPKVVQMDRN